MENKVNPFEIELNGVQYIRKDSITESKNVISTDGLQFVIIRTYSAGVHFGYLKERNSTLAGIEVKLINAQRMRYWEGAMDLSQLANEGSTKPSACKPSVIIPEIDIVAIEIIPISEKAAKSFSEMKIWKV